MSDTTLPKPLKRLELFNKLNSMINVPLDWRLFRRFEYLNSFAIISFDSRIKNPKPYFEFLIRSEYEDSELKNVFESKETIIEEAEKIQNEENSIWIILKNENEFNIARTSFIDLNSSDFFAGPYFTENEARIAMNLLNGRISTQF